MEKEGLLGFKPSQAVSEDGCDTIVCSPELDVFVLHGEPLAVRNLLVKSKKSFETNGLLVDSPSFPSPTQFPATPLAVQ